MVEPLGSGTDHVAYLVDDRLVVRFAADGDPARVEREAAVLDAVAPVTPVAVPRPVFVVPEEGCIAYERLPGVPLLDVPGAVRGEHAAVVGTRLGGLLRALHDLPRERMGALAGTDDVPLEDWHSEAAELRDAVAAALPPDALRAVDAFLAQAPPAGPAALVFSHNDLGIEHVLVDPATLDVTGVIDWGDAAVADPARDFGRILRDLGPAALDAAAAAYGVDAPLVDRVRFHARCALLEDLAYGLEGGGDEYTDKSLEGVSWLF